MQKLMVVALLSVWMGVAWGGFHPVVTPDILEHVSHVLSHGYGGKVVLGYPQKAHLVDASHGVDIYPGHGGGYHGGYLGGHGGGYHGGHGGAGYYGGHGGHGYHGGHGGGYHGGHGGHYHGGKGHHGGYY